MQGLANTAWSIAPLRCDDTPLLDSIASAALPMLYDRTVPAGPAARLAAASLDAAATCSEIRADGRPWASAQLYCQAHLPLTWALAFSVRPAGWRDLVTA